MESLANWAPISFGKGKFVNINDSHLLYELIATDVHVSNLMFPADGKQMQLCALHMILQEVLSLTQQFVVTIYVYKEIWSNPVHEEWLVCEYEIGNWHDPLSVVMKKLMEGNSTVVGHVPRRISPFCSIFIKRGGSIMCIVDGLRR